MDIKARNKEVKKILSQEYGRKNVSVTNGKGTSWGWCYVEIKTFNSRTNNRQSIKKGRNSYCPTSSFTTFTLTTIQN